MTWLDPWHPEDPGDADPLAAELVREVRRGHPLFGVAVRTLGRRLDCDDVLFALEDGSGRVAVVHLTWTSSPPDRPPWPSAEVWPSLAAWAADGMARDHRGHA